MALDLGPDRDLTPEHPSGVYGLQRPWWRDRLDSFTEWVVDHVSDDRDPGWWVFFLCTLMVFFGAFLGYALAHARFAQ